jgi:hypothetical protein
MRYGLEVYELALPVGGSVATLSGAALTLRREINALAIGVRVGGAFDPDAHTSALHLTTQVDAQVEAVLYARPVESFSLFASALVGLVYQRFAGPAPLDGPGATGVVPESGLAVAVRGGVEGLRVADVHFLAFLELEAPTFASRDPDHGVINQWVPAASLGVGALF